MRAKCIAAFLFLLTLSIFSQQTSLRTERFDRDPNWDGHNNRIGLNNSVTVRQDFGYTNNSPFHKAAIGGWISTAASPAFYAKKLETLTLSNSFSASGKIIVPKGGQNILIGFFNDATAKEWRTANTIALRIDGRKTNFYSYVEYCTSMWRAGAVFPRKGPDPRRFEFVGGETVHTWSLSYNAKTGIITGSMDGQETPLDFEKGHRNDGITVNHFGILNCLKSDEMHEGSMWIADLVINGERESLDKDPKWDARNNRKTYEGDNVRPRFNFGYSPTHFAGGERAGELGGIVFCGDERFPERMAYYGDRVGNLSLEQPLEASGRVVLLRGPTDSRTLLGFFNSKESIRHGKSQTQSLPPDFIGVSIEGPSREGFYFYPVYASDRLGDSGTVKKHRPYIYPDGKSHAWRMKYDPKGNDGDGNIVVTFDDKSCTAILKSGVKQDGANFDRFGIVTTLIDGNGQTIYFDDLSYTVGESDR